MSERHPIWEVADALQMDLRAASAKLVELRGRIAALNLPDPREVRCPKCGVERKGPMSLAEHMYQSHGGPLPDHLARIDERALEPEEDYE